MSPDGQDSKTIMRLRFGVGAIGILLPVVLPLGNWIMDWTKSRTGVEVWPGSMSGSYYTSTRDIFVGSLCALGVFLIAYRFNPKQDLASTLAGFLALGVAFCPTAPSANATAGQQLVGAVHLGFAGLLLFTLAGFCWAMGQAQEFTGDGNKTVRFVCHAAGTLIPVFVVLAGLMSAAKIGVGMAFTPLYLFEALSVWAFGFAWLVAAFALAKKIGALAAG